MAHPNCYHLYDSKKETKPDDQKAQSKIEGDDIKKTWHKEKERDITQRKNVKRTNTAEGVIYLKNFEKKRELIIFYNEK